jgi:hypothetical protein
MSQDNTTDSATSETELNGGTVQDEIYAPEQVGEEYRSAVYEDINYDSLETATEAAEFPTNTGRGQFKITDLPEVPKISHIIGPSAIMLGLGLGSGETMFWPTLIAQNGWAFYWAFWIGVVTQFFINTELQRWTIATGESIFQGFDRVHTVWPWFLLVFGIFQAGWPGWAAGAAKVFAAGIGLGQANWVLPAAILMVLIWLSYQVGPIMYNIVESIETVLVATAILFAVILMFLIGSFGQLVNIPAGAVNFGALPQDMDIATFLGGLAYAGVGGYGNLSQGVWAREKGYGMGRYQGRVKNPLRGRDGESEDVHDSGFTFRPTERNLKRWRGWWKVTQQEHFLTFGLGVFIVGTISMTLAAELAAGTNQGAINMWINVIIPQMGSLGAFLTYVMIFIALFTTQYAVFESFVRNSVDIIYEMYGRQAGWNLNRIFWGLLTLFALVGIIIILARIEEPWILLVVGAAAAGVMMWPYNALTIILNTTQLPEHLQPGWARTIAMWWATGFFGYFSVLLIGSVLNNPEFGLSFSIMQTTVTVIGSAPGGYVLWMVALAVQIYTMYRSGKAKLAARGTVDGAEEAKGFLA